MLELLILCVIVDHFSDNALEKIAEKTNVIADEIANRMCVDAKYVKDKGANSKEKVLAVLEMWRESKEVVKHADKAADILKAACEVYSIHMDTCFSK